MRYLKADTLEALRDSIEDNLERYRDGTFADLFKDLDDSTRLLPGDFDVSRLSELRSPIPDELFDAENSKLVYDALSALTPLQAREERIWVFLTHTSCLDYTRARWPIPASTEKAVKHVKAHFFAPSLRAVERDNSISRLWWMGMIAGRATGLSADEALEVLMFRTDVRANVPPPAQVYPSSQPSCGNSRSPTTESGSSTSGW
jgi:hypothetical protein